MILLAMTLFCACTKTGTQGSGSGTTNARLLIKTSNIITYDTTTGAQTSQNTVADTYDANNRLTSQVENASIASGGNAILSVDTFTYVYGSGTVTLTENVHTNNVLLQFISKYYVNAAITQVDSIHETETEKGVTLLNQVSKLTYSPAGQCTELDNYDVLLGGNVSLATKYLYSYSGNDLSKIALQTSNGTLISTTTFVYNTNSKGNLAPANETFAPPFLPPVTGDLIASQTQTVNGNAPITVTFSYSFDGQHRITQESEKTNTGKLIVQQTLTYQ